MTNPLRPASPRKEASPGSPQGGPPARTLDEQIAEQLAESQRNGELRSAPSWGKPLDFGDGYEETPVELRMGFKVLKDAGVVPHEVEMLRQVGELRQRLADVEAEGQGGGAEAASLRQRIAELQQAVALRLEKLASTRSL